MRLWYDIPVSPLTLAFALAARSQLYGSCILHELYINIHSAISGERLRAGSRIVRAYDITRRCPSRFASLPTCSIYGRRVHSKPTPAVPALLSPHRRRSLQHG